MANKTRREKEARRRARKRAQQAERITAGKAREAQEELLMSDIVSVCTGSGSRSAIIVTDDRDAPPRGSLGAAEHLDGVRLHIVDNTYSQVPVGVLVGMEPHLWTANPEGNTSRHLIRQLNVLARCEREDHGIVPPDKTVMILHQDQVTEFVAAAQSRAKIGLSLKVGDHLPEFVGRPDGAHYNFDAAGHMLTITMRGPTAEEILAFEGGRVDLSLVVRTHALFVCARFRHGETSMWHDATYTAHRVPHAQRVAPDTSLPPGRGHALLMILVDSSTGEIKGLRIITMSHHLSLSLAKAIEAQLRADGSVQDHDRVVDETFRRFPTPAALAKAAQVRMTAPAKLGPTAIA